MKLVLLESGELSTEAQPVPSASTPNLTAPRHERKMPEQMKLLLEPGAENTPWGDLFWRMYGRPDGSLGEELNQEALAHWEEIVALSLLHPTPLLPLPECHWPLSHADRVRELELLPSRTPNISAAIEYHKTFDQKAFCSNERIYFQEGRRKMEEELNYEPFWVEGIQVQVMNQQPLQYPLAPPPPLYPLAQVFQHQEPGFRTKEASYPFDQQMIMQKVNCKSGTYYYFII